MFDIIILIVEAKVVNEVTVAIYGKGCHTYMEFSVKVKQERQRIGITQEELAARTGLSQRSIAAYESQGVVARYKNIVKLADVFQVTVEYLMNDDMQEPIYVK